MRLPTLSARASIVILMAISLVLGANSALADDRGDRRGGKFDNPGFNRHNDRGGRAHDRDRNDRHDNRRDNRFDSGSFFGGVVLGSLLSANHSGANRYTASNYRGTLHYGGRYRGHFDRRFDLRRGTGYRYSTHYPTFGPTVFGHGRIYSSRYDGSRFDVWRGGRTDASMLAARPLRSVQGHEAWPRGIELGAQRQVQGRAARHRILRAHEPSHA